MVFINCTPKDVDTYYYKRQGFDDRGWGCVYRCAQTVMATLGYAQHDPEVRMPDGNKLKLLMPHIPDMMYVLGVPHSASPKQMWIEPKQVRDLLVHYCGPRRSLGHRTTQGLTWEPRLIGFGVAANQDLLLRTSREDFDTEYADWRPFHNDVVRHLRRHESPVVLDDGTSGMCVTGFRGTLGSASGEYFMVDPHATGSGLQFKTESVHEYYTRRRMVMALVS